LDSTCGVPVAARYHSRLLPPLACFGTSTNHYSTYEADSELDGLVVLLVHGDSVTETHPFHYPSPTRVRLHLASDRAGPLSCLNNDDYTTWTALCCAQVMMVWSETRTHPLQAPWARITCAGLVRSLRLLYLILLPYDWCCLRCWVDLKEESIYDAQVRICSIARPIIFLGAPPDLDMQPQQ
jgi:hypothetical protein